MAGVTPEAARGLLDRAAEVGLLTAHSGGFYSIHPALPWFFRGLFEQRDMEARKRALRAHVEAMALAGNFYHNQYASGNPEATGALKAEEPNLLHSRALARQHGWWPEVIATMQGLDDLYYHTSRKAEWARLVEEIVPEFVDPAAGGPLAGREGHWGLVTGYRVRLAIEARSWDEAERLQLIRVDWDRRRARDKDRNRIRSLAVSLHQLGKIQFGMGRLECVDAYRESFDLLVLIEDRSAAGNAALDLGNVHIILPALRNLDEAERWYRKSLELIPDGDRMSRAGSLGQMGGVAYERFKEADAAKRPEPELLRHLNEAIRRYREALEMTPPDAVEYLATGHSQLGNIYDDAGDHDRALHHLREAIRLREAGGDLYGAADTRYNVARTLARTGRLADARQYAEAALRDFQTYGSGAADKVQLTLALISYIAKAAAT